MGNRLLILGSQDEFVELVRCARKRGIYTVVCDGRLNGPAKKEADLAFDVDIMDTAAITEICKSTCIDHIITSFSDILFEQMVYIADMAGLPCYIEKSNVKFLRNKTCMKQMLDELNIKHTKVQCVVEAGKAPPCGIIFPAVVKPTSGWGSKGVNIVKSEPELAAYMDQFDAEQPILIEEYCADEEINLQSWLIDGEPYILSTADREKSSPLCPGDIPTLKRVIYPAQHSKLFLDEAIDILRRVSTYTGLRTGPMCMQFFWNPKDGIRIVEVTGRLFGYEHELVTIGSGLSIEELLLNSLYDADRMRVVLENHSWQYKRPVAGIYFQQLDGIIADQSAASKLLEEPEVVLGNLYYKVGDETRYVGGTNPYIARYFIQADTVEQVNRFCDRFYQECRIYDISGENLVFPHTPTGTPVVL